MDRHRQVTLDARLARVDYARTTSRSGASPAPRPRSAIDGRRRESCRSNARLSAASCQPWSDSFRQLSSRPAAVDRAAVANDRPDRAAAEPRPRGKGLPQPIAGFTGTPRRDTLRSAQIALAGGCCAMCPSTPACSATGRHRPNPTVAFEGNTATLAASLTFLMIHASLFDYAESDNNTPRGRSMGARMVCEVVRPASRTAASTPSPRLPEKIFGSHAKAIVIRAPPPVNSSYGLAAMAVVLSDSA